MTRAEIKKKFDEIVDFAGVEKFLDTPVKRYSSGMYVRLAFAVAAHLEPEILVVDEVLAVGDAEFQKKCLGKMKDVAGRGRTVLFVSHNMAAVEALCSSSLLLVSGRVNSVGPTQSIVSAYASLSKQVTRPLTELNSKGRKDLWISKIRFFSRDQCIVDGPTTGQSIDIEISMEGPDSTPRSSRIGVAFFTTSDVPLFLCANEVSLLGPLPTADGSVVSCRIDRFPLGGGTYHINLFLERDGVIDYWLEDPYLVVVNDAPFYGTPRNAPNGHEGKSVLISHSWHVK